jgi:hypothetical protein
MLAGLGMLTLVSVLWAGSAILLGFEFDLVTAEGNLPLLSVIALSIEAILLLASAIVGGFVAGRLARYNGMLVGLGSSAWLTAVLAIGAGLALGVAAVTDVVDQLDLPARLSNIDTPGVATAAAITGGGLLVLTLLSGLFGGRLGQTETKPAGDTVVDLSDVDAPREADTRETETGEFEAGKTETEEAKTENARASV